MFPGGAGDAWEQKIREGGGELRQAVSHFILVGLYLVAGIKGGLRGNEADRAQECLKYCNRKFIGEKKLDRKTHICWISPLLSGEVYYI